MDELGVDRIFGRPIRLFRLSDWVWVHPRLKPFVLFVAARATPEDEVEIRRFAAAAISSGCGFVCAWGEGCEFVHDLFDVESIAAGRFVMSSWHAQESLAEALYFALTGAWPDDEEFPDAAKGSVILAAEDPWLAEVRRLAVDQDELNTIVLGEDAQS